MHYVFLTNSVVTDQCQPDPYTVFYPEYASQFIEAADEVTFGWTYESGVFVPPPPIPPPTPEELKQQNKSIASQRLQETDWVDLGPVGDPMVLPHLANVADFNSYRLALRAIAVNPPITVDPWPAKPDEIWVTE